VKLKKYSELQHPFHFCWTPYCHILCATSCDITRCDGEIMKGKFWRGYMSVPWKTNDVVLQELILKRSRNTIWFCQIDKLTNQCVWLGRRHVSFWVISVLNLPRAFYPTVLLHCSPSCRKPWRTDDCDQHFSNLQFIKILKEHDCCINSTAPLEFVVPSAATALACMLDLNVT